MLRDLLQGLESRLRYVRRDVERREALAAATPSIWPAHGWLTGTFGGRSDPFTGEPGFHQGLDISTDKGQPVYATADGTVESAAYTGDYGNLIVLQHGFGLTTRYGHLSAFNVKPGQTVKRGDVIGYVGSTGRVDRRAPALRDSRQRQAASTRCSCSPSPRTARPRARASRLPSRRSPRPSQRCGPCLADRDSLDSRVLQSLDTHSGSSTL